jgi:hypothetical protein
MSYRMSRSRVFGALGAAGLLALPACSSGTHPPAAVTTSAPAASAGTTSPAAPVTSVRIGRFTQEFATPLPADQAQAKIIEGWREAQILWSKSLIAWRLVPGVTGYVTGVARNHLLGAISYGKQNDAVPAGADRMFMTSVTSVEPTAATITTCDDGSRFAEVNPKTGAVNQAFATPADHQYLYETWHMVPVGGHWAIGSFTLATLPAAAARHCQP